MSVSWMGERGSRKKCKLFHLGSITSLNIKLLIVILKNIISKLPSGVMDQRGSEGDPEREKEWRVML